MADRTATASWNGTLTEGSGTVSLTSSGIVVDAPITWHARTETSDGQTSPEELLAAAHAACFAMAFSADLGRAGTPPEHLHVEAEVTFDKLEEGWTVVSSALTVIGRAPGATAESFDAVAEGTRVGCPISRALAGNVAITVEATLETDG